MFPFSPLQLFNLYVTNRGQIIIQSISKLHAIQKEKKRWMTRDMAHTVKAYASKQMSISEQEETYSRPILRKDATLSSHKTNHIIIL